MRLCQRRQRDDGHLQGGKGSTQAYACLDGGMVVPMCLWDCFQLERFSRIVDYNNDIAIILHGIPGKTDACDIACDKCTSEGGKNNGICEEDLRRACRVGNTNDAPIEIGEEDRSRREDDTSREARQ